MEKKPFSFRSFTVFLIIGIFIIIVLVISCDKIVKLTKERRLNKRIANAEKSIKDNPANYEAYRELGRAYAAKGLNEKAVLAYNKAVKINPEKDTDEDLHYRLATQYGANGDSDNMVLEFKKVIAINPKHAKAYNYLCEYYCVTKQYDLAKQYCDKAVELGYGVDPFYLERVEAGLKAKEASAQ